MLPKTHANQEGAVSLGVARLRLKRLFRIAFARLHRSWETKIALALIVCGFFSGIATYAAFTERAPFGNASESVIWLLNIDLIILLLLGMLIARRIVGLWSGRKRKLAGSHLHVRLVYLFSILAAAPAIIMTVFSALFFHYGIQTWFSQRVQTAISESQAVAEAYLAEHKQVIAADTFAMANDIDRQAIFLAGSPQALEHVVQTQSLIRNLSEAIVFDSSNRILARSQLAFSLEFEDVPLTAIEEARDGEVVIMTGRNDDRVRALIKLNNFVDSYLYVGRMVDPKVLSHLDATKRASEDYESLQARYADFQVLATLIFIVVGFILLLMAIWFGLYLARQLVEPISILITTADRVRSGDLTARVPEQKTLEEFDFLAKAFNRMTRQIEEQQNELINANRQIDRRRQLTETVLTGVTSGVIGVDSEGVINLANQSAAQLLQKQNEVLVGQKIAAVFPGIEDLLESAHKRPAKTTQAEIPVYHNKDSRRSFLVRIVIELIGAEDVGAILTFDDITELQSAQRKAAWADVARRIAHEIKNPLTPIQLSAERLRRKYLKQIKDDPEIFAKCTDTIIKHVEDIGRMVNEFSSFARMPEPVLKPGELMQQVEEVVFLHRQAHSHILFEIEREENAGFEAVFDPQQIRQALNNLVQNAVDSIDMRIENEKEKSQELGGRVRVILGMHDSEPFIAVSDNGIGLPQNENPINLTEPYVTHKPKGTGLGLAIVKKIMEDHKGEILLGIPGWLKKSRVWQDLGGATIILIFTAQIPLEANNNQPASKANLI